MAESVDTAAEAFHQAIDPVQTADEQPAPQRVADRSRDANGRFAQVAERPEPIFPLRMLEGDPETGDISDGGDNPRLRQREREIADGRVDERAERQAAADTADKRVDAAAATGDDDAADEESEDAATDAAGDEEGEDDLENSQFEITVDGETHQVSLGEMRDGYIRTATFHSRLNKVNEHKAVVEQENQRVSQMRDLYINGLTALDHDMRLMFPTEPDWDKEFELNPQAAHRKQKEFRAYHDKLNQIRANRAWAEQNRREEQDRASAKYAVEQFTQFVDDHRKIIKDEPSLQQVIGGMRKTALAEGFAEHEVAGVYDKRMLNVLYKAWLYDQGMAVRPQAQAALSSPGKALAPGSARPLSGSAGRRNVDEASKQLARTGRMEDATAYFHRLLR